MDGAEYSCFVILRINLAGYDNYSTIRYLVTLEGKITKQKVLALILVISLLACFALPSSAASGVNKAEQQVLKMVQKGEKYNKDFYQYYNALKIYFNRDSISISQIQADSSCGYLIDMYDLYAAQEMTETKFFDKFQYVLMYLNIRIIYNRADSTADLIGGDGSLVMASLKLGDQVDGKSLELEPIKQTGGTLLKPVLYTGGAVGVFALALFMVLILKKRKETIS